MKSNNFIVASIKVVFDEVLEADTVAKILRKYITKETNMFKIKRSKNVINLLVDIQTDEDWNNATFKDLGSLRPDFLELDKFSEKDREKFTDACDGLDRIDVNLSLGVDL